MPAADRLPPPGLDQARLAFEAADYAACIALCETAQAGRPADAALLHLLGVARLRRGNAKAAIATLARALALAPADLSLRIDHALALTEMGQADQAVALLAAGAQWHPGNPDLALRLGGLLSDQGLYDMARTIFQAGIEARPEHPALRSRMAAECAAEMLYDRALTHLTALDRLCPGDSAVLSNIALIRQAMGDLDDAVEIYQRAIAITPDDAQAHMNLGLVHLTRGQWVQGFREFEWRLALPGQSAGLPDLPRWQGDRLAGRHLLVSCEQGFGDCLQYSRFLASLATQDGPVTLLCPPQLKRLFSGIEGIAVTAGPDLPSADLTIPLLSLPFQLGLAPPAPPFLSAAPIPGRLPFSGPGVKIGLITRCRPAGGDVFLRRTLDRRACPPEHLAPLLAVEGARFFLLSPEDATGPAGPCVDLTPAIGDFADTAALMCGLDLIISIDTAAAHLAGALGRPLWVMLGPGPADHRWGPAGRSSPWYPAARLFRGEGRQWPEIVASVAAALSHWIAGSGPSVMG